MAQSRLAVSVMRGWSLSAEGPGASAENNCMPPMPSRGRMAIVSTMMPMPPIQWVMDRQRRMPGATTSMSSRMVAPVVV